MLVDALTEWQCDSMLENKPSQTNLRAPPPDTLLYPLWEKQNKIKQKNKLTLILLLLLFIYDMSWCRHYGQYGFDMTWDESKPFSD